MFEGTDDFLLSSQVEGRAGERGGVENVFFDIVVFGGRQETK